MPPSLITLPFQGKKVNKPPPPPPIILQWLMFLILGCVPSNFLYLRFSTLHSSSLWRTDTAIFAKLTPPPPPSLKGSPSLSSLSFWTKLTCVPVGESRLQECAYMLNGREKTRSMCVIMTQSLWNAYLYSETPITKAKKAFDNPRFGSFHAKWL